MPTEKPRITFTISRERLSDVEAYRFENKFKNQTQAILSLLEKGLYGFEKEKASSLSDKARIVAERYSELDPHGQEAVDAILDVEYRRCTESSRPSEIHMIKAAARSGDVSEIEEVYREDLSEDEAIPV